MNQDDYYMMRDDGNEEQSETSPSFRNNTLLHFDDSVEELEKLFFGGHNERNQ